MVGWHHVPDAAGVAQRVLRMAVAQPCKRVLGNEWVTGLIRQSFAMSDHTYGLPRVWRDLLDWGEKVGVGENRVARLMR